ncbi:2Fe-2S iron-sulfur cluster-binding protein [Haliangium sp.]|uniref:2Fe-2S iron-sulfur cluster-binding protein n=1 Tax=Haliangium sp. TaxID=2663208 RepID=UPI003D0DC5CC
MDTPLSSSRPSGRLARLSPRLAEWVEQARVDARMVLDGLRGRHPAPLIERRPDGHELRRPRASERAARVLRVAAVERHTPDAIAFAVQDPSGRPLAFVPGQFFTLLVDIDGRSYRRAYSVAGRHEDSGGVLLAVKRVAGGRVSGYLVDHLQPGRLVRVLGPSGEFTCAPEPAARRHLVLIGGGSGITPLLAIATAVLEEEPDSAVTLVYGNRSQEDIIFRDRIEALRAHFGARGDARLGARFAVEHVLERPPAGWTGPVGLLDEQVLGQALDPLEGRVALPRRYYLCGPAPMLAAARAALVGRGVADADIAEERFTQPHLRAGQAADADATASPQTVRVRVDGREHEVVVGPGETVLDAALAAGLEMPFSCAMGGCGACKVVLREGALALEEPNCLSERERAAGYVLTCVARASGPAAVEVEVAPR